MKATYTLVHNRKNQLNKQGKALVQIQVYYSKERKWLGTNIYLTPKEWDAKRMQVSRAHPQCDELNKELQTHIEKLQTFERNEAKAGRALRLDALNLDTLKNVSHDLTFTDFWANWIETDPQLEHETKRSQRSELKRLREYKKDIHFFELTPELLRGYENFLVNYRFTDSKGKEKPLSAARIHCLFKTLRIYVNKAIKEGHLEPQNNPFLRFSTAKYRKALNHSVRKFLTSEEAQLLEKAEIPAHLAYLERIRDMFLLSCYAGFRYSDVIRLDESCLRDSDEGLSLYLNLQKKTKNDVLVPVSLLFGGKPEQIVRKYLDKGEVQPFQGLSNQHVNRSLKQLAFLAGLNRSLPFHMARHSCATLLLDAGLSYEVVKQILGHTNIRTTHIYGKVRKEAVKNALKAVKWQG